MKKTRKLVSFTIDFEIIEKLSLLSHQIGLNKSKIIEKLIKEYSLEKEAIYVSNSSGPISIPINEIAIKVAKILKQK
jgi:predicted DNA-binding protein